MPALGCLPNPLDQAVEDNEEMVYKRVRDDGVSKRDKLRVESRRARLAAIPSRTVIDGTLTMQIKGRATASSHRSLTQRGEASIEAQHHDARSVGVSDFIPTCYIVCGVLIHRQPLSPVLPILPAQTSHSKRKMQVKTAVPLLKRSSNARASALSQLSAIFIPLCPHPTPRAIRNWVCM